MQRLSGDGWWPLLQWPYVLMGNTTVTVIDLRTNQVVLQTNGWPSGWYGPNVVAYTRVAGVQDRELFICPIGGVEQKLFKKTFMGNHPVASEGHVYWTTGQALFIDGLLGYVGDFHVSSPTVGVDGYVGVRQGQDVWVFKGGVVREIYTPQTDYAHRIVPGANESCGYGYWGDSFLLTPQGEYNITLYGPESPAVVVDVHGQEWLVRATEQEGFGMGVISGPVDDLKVIGWPNLPSVHLHAQVVEDTIKIVGNNAQGQAFFVEHNATDPRKALGEEEMPEIELVAPGVEVTQFSKVLENGKAATFEFYDRNNPTLGVKVKVELVPTGEGKWSWHATLTNTKGSNRSGMKREMALKGSSGPAPVDPPPSSGDKYAWRGNFLAFPGYEMAFMFPAWSQEKQENFLRDYRAAGHTHLPLSPFARYGGLEYDFSQDPQVFNNLIKRLKDKGIYVCVMAFTDAFKSHHPRTFDAAVRWASSYIPQLTAMELCCSGWEFNQININTPEYWCGDGTKHLEWGRFLKGLLPAGVPLYCHFSPERITGWPNYPNHDGPQDEPGWWKADNPFDGILYQRRPDEKIEFTIAHTIGGKAEDGSTDVGDAQRINGGHWGISKRFVFFEHSRTQQRWQQIVDRIKGDKRIDGWC